MALVRRYAIPGQPQHMIQRGNNRRVTCKYRSEMRLMGLESPILGWIAIEVKTQALMRLLEAKCPEIRANFGVSWK